MKHTIKGFLVYETDSWRDDNERVAFQSITPWATQAAVLIRAHDFDVDVPDNFDPRAEQVAQLKEKQRKAGADFAALTTEINRQISQLQAIAA